MIRPVLLTALLTLTTLFACSKDDNDPVAVPAPAVDIQSPAEDAEVTGPIAIRVAVSGERVRTVQVYVKNADTDALLFADAPTVDNSTNFLYTRTVTLNLTAATPLQLNVIAESENGGRTNKTISFNYVP